MFGRAIGPWSMMGYGLWAITRSCCWVRRRWLLLPDEGWLGATHQSSQSLSGRRPLAQLREHDGLAWYTVIHTPEKQNRAVQWEEEAASRDMHTLHHPPTRSRHAALATKSCGALAQSPPPPTTSNRARSHRDWMPESLLLLLLLLLLPVHRRYHVITMYNPRIPLHPPASAHPPGML
jgi:hypothetical protein